jgi:hypothetical protein
MSLRGPGDEIQQYMAEVRGRVAAKRQSEQTPVPTTAVTVPNDSLAYRSEWWPARQGN